MPYVSEGMSFRKGVRSTLETPLTLLNDPQGRSAIKKWQWKRTGRIESNRRCCCHVCDLPTHC